ncbi:hypothetical protein DXT99_23715 [Pontibacter diazotrophicus]|uniref:Signal transduction histidine kinase internal region domain-containing protein n=1 Tax=Pontibacter diazotrophicus TaxID=1400979 RepID=A0A3D8L3E9_9BACT|nr:histidine kinase [Pontibacter diazotrophicus]RDV11797.1 hypothetical protein DXT99_23715 [Pontibacter diazotrophicus]
MMYKQKSYIKDLVIVAVLTSLFFGVFSVLPSLIHSHLSFVAPPPPPGRMGPGPRLMGERPPVDIAFSVLMATLMMLVLWVMNILLYDRFRKLPLKDRKKSIIRYTASFLGMFLLISLYFLVRGNFTPGPRYGRALFFPLIAALTNNIIVLVILDLVVLQRNKAQVELENTQLKMNSIQAQHQHLKHQLQPHFLFNSLNTLKTLIRKQPQEAEDYLLRLSDFLRASLSNTRDTVTLGEELRLCVDYFEMQKVRFRNAFSYKIDLPPKLKETAYVPVFSLQLLAENAIKHNGFTEEEPLRIHFTYNKNGHLVVRNNKKPKLVNEPSSGIGLRNLTERYKVLSGEGITIVDSEEFFTVQLPILDK